jgi:membrane fusion protein (multidrug efflux system)
MINLRAVLTSVVGSLALGTACPAENPASGPPDGGGVRSEGLVTPYREIKLAVETDGVVIETLIKEGERVKQGQPLGRLDDRRAALAERLSRAVAEKRQADLASLQKLFQEKVASRNDLEKAQVEAESALAELEAARIEVEKRRIVSPIDGHVLRLAKEVGESIERLQTFAEIVDTSKAHVILYLPAGEIHTVKVGQKALVTIPLVRPEPFEGFVEMVDPVVDPAAGIFRAKVVVPNAEGAIITGTRSQVVIVTGES